MALVFQSITIAASSSLDNLSVGIGYALKGVKISVQSNAVVATINSAGMAMTMLVGSSVRRRYRFRIPLVLESVW